MTLHIGCDPGATGALAVLNNAGELEALEDLPMISDGKLRWTDSTTLLQRLLDIKAGRPAVALVERQSARPGQGVSSTFSIGCTFGSLLATLQAAGCAITFVTAAKWKADCGLSTDKSASLDRARLLFPLASLDRKKDHNRGEALLLANYLWRSRK